MASVWKVMFLVFLGIPFVIAGYEDCNLYGNCAPVATSDFSGLFTDLDFTGTTGFSDFVDNTGGAGAGMEDLNVTTDSGSGSINDDQIWTITGSGTANVQTSWSGTTMTITATDTDTDDQTLTWTNATRTLTIVDGNSVYIPDNDTIYADDDSIYYFSIDNITETKINGKLCFYNATSNLLNCSYTDQIGITSETDPFWTGNSTNVAYLDAENAFTAQNTFNASNGQIVGSNSAGTIILQTASGQAGSLSFGNTADIGISQDGVIGGYDYDGSMIFKQKTSNPDGVVEFLFIEENNNWRFAIPSSGADLATGNPRSAIFGYGADNNESDVTCSHHFNYIDCNTGGSGGDVGVADDLEVKGQVFGTLANESDPLWSANYSTFLTHITLAQYWTNATAHFRQLTNVTFYSKILANAGLRLGGTLEANENPITGVTTMDVDELRVDNYINLTGNGQKFYFGNGQYINVTDNYVLFA